MQKRGIKVSGAAIKISFFSITGISFYNGMPKKKNALLNNQLTIAAIPFNNRQPVQVSDCLHLNPVLFY